MRPRWTEVQAVTREAVDYFGSQEVHREALGALLLFRQAAEAEAVTARQIRRLARYLDQARHDPALRYEPPA